METNVVKDYSVEFEFEFEHTVRRLNFWTSFLIIIVVIITFATD